jgi:hypothetical protein
MRAGDIGALAVERIKRDTCFAKSALHEDGVCERSAQLRPHDRAHDERPKCRGRAKGAERRCSIIRIVL